eukprot:11498470-Ditylum_brightwellii.AAC.1
MAETEDKTKRDQIKLNNKEEKTDQEWEMKYGKRSRDGLRPRKNRSNIPNKFREYDNAMSQ